MQNKKTRGFIIFAAFVLVFALLFVIFTNPLSGHYVIFESIEECERLLTYETSGGEAVRYTEPTLDKNIHGLVYQEFFGMSYQSAAMEYEIFAYMFEDKDSALQYFINETGMNSYKKNIPLRDDDPNRIFSAISGTSSYRVIVISGTRAYCLTAPVRYTEAVNEMLTEVFSETVHQRK